ncbi:MAG: N-acetylmuramoyl-L-alanine amidase [Thermonemataceae bacterium]|nr:N-acetylmuramoyl-L-alanine amidase [Thermonemataceae bacterium]
MKLIFFLIVLFFSGFYVNAQNALYVKNLEKYLLKEKSLHKKVFLDSLGLHFFGNILSEDSLERIAQTYTIYEEIKRLQTIGFAGSFLGKPQTLVGWRIAIDPGHFAGDWETAKIEGKFIEMNLADSIKIGFYESALAWATAHILKEKLEKKGAKVMLTRSKVSYTAFEKTFEDSYQTYLKGNLTTTKKGMKKRIPLRKGQFFRLVFRKRELEERVRKINDFRPHITLVIHYNVDENNTNWRKPSKENFAMAFVGGAFEATDFENKTLHKDFLRLLVSLQLTHSLNLSEHILFYHQKIAKVPIIEPSNNQGYLQEKAIFTGKQGIYSRNLLLSRAVESPVCYGESLFQDSFQEIRKLNEKTLKINDFYTSPRVLDIAEAYFRGILSYCQHL